ncbi:MAG TPA: phosphodiester glycosidase family protein [Bacteroidia bacterium]|nr:phosphodiester glycosidase family protein [Bacteroidia bacterium]
MVAHPTLFGPFLLALLLASASAADDSPPAPETVEHAGTRYWVQRVDAKRTKIDLYLGEPAGKPNTFPALEQRLAKQGRRLIFAMNAGIFEGTLLPTGLHIADGKETTPLNLGEFVKSREGELTPNFYLKPNGVFLIRADGSVAVLESSRYAAAGEKPVLATQSGPLLVAGGSLHPVLQADSTSRRYRNGVGVNRAGEIVFVCSVRDREHGVSNLYRFAELFRDRLDCPDALYLDGDISYLYLRGHTGPIKETNWFAGILAISEPGD